MYHWITIISQKPIAALNTLWHFSESRNFKAVERFTLFCDPGQQDQAEWFRQRVEILLKYRQKKSPKFEIRPIEEEALRQFRKALKQLLNKSPQKVIIDMTSGRKAHSALLLLLGDLFSGNVAHVFYNFLERPEMMHLPFPALPPSAFRVLDMLEK